MYILSERSQLLRDVMALSSSVPTEWDWISFLWLSSNSKKSKKFGENMKFKGPYIERRSGLDTICLIN